MKQLLIAIALITIGFYGGYLLNNNQAATDRNPTQAGFNSKDILNLELQNNLNGQKTSIRKLNYEGISQQSTVFAQFLYVYELANQANAKELETYLKQSIQSRDPLYNFNIVTILFEAYTALDPLAAISFVEKNPRFLPESFISHIVTSWVRNDPEAAIDYFLSIRNKRLIQSLGARLLQEPSLIEAGMLTEIAEKMGPRPNQIIENARIRNLEPEQAFAEAQYLRGTARMRQMQTSVARWMRSDPDAALSRISNMENKQERSQLLQLAYSQFASRDALSALLYLREHHANDENLEQNILTIFAQQDVQGALPLIESFSERTGKTNAMRALLARWVQIDPIASIAYAETLGDKQKLDVYQSISRSYQQIDPEAGLVWALGLDPKYREVSERAAMQIQAHNIDAAQTLLDSISDKRVRNTLFSSIARVKGQSDPESALQWLDDYKEDPAYNSALQNIMTSWSMNDPAAAAAALDDFSDTGHTQPIVSQIAQSWYRTKPDEAIEWVLSRPAGESKYNAITNIAQMIGRTDSDAALKLIEDLPTTRQQQARMNLAYTMLLRDASQVENLIQSLKLSEANAERIRSYANQLHSRN